MSHRAVRHGAEMQGKALRNKRSRAHLPGGSGTFSPGAGQGIMAGDQSPIDPLCSRAQAKGTPWVAPSADHRGSIPSI